MTKKILLDTNVYISYFEGKLNSTDVEKFKSLVEKDSFSFVASIYNIIELANVKNPLQKQKELCRWIDNVSKLWIHDTWVIQTEEMKHFIFKNYYEIDHIFNIFTPYLSVCLDVLDHQRNPQTTRLSSGISAETLLVDSNKTQHILDQGKANNIQAAITIKNALKAKMYDFENNKIFYEWVIESLLPKRKPNGEFICIYEKEKIINWLHEQGKHEILKNCPTVAIENHFLEYRRNNLHRKPKNSDVFDLLILSSAIPYCDYFITEDKFIKDSLRYIYKKKYSQYFLKAQICTFKEFIDETKE